MMGGEANRSREADWGPDGRLASDLWIDRDDAPAEIARRRAAGALTAREAENLEKFWRDGYFVFRPTVASDLFAAVCEDVDRLWREQPPWMAFALHSLLTRFPGDEAEKRRPSSRIADLHDFSTPALELYLHPEIFRYVELILGEPAVATQSLYFEWGSMQALHRDPIHVRMTPPAHLVASWLALETIQPGSGELHYVPGSHRLPYFAFSPGRYIFDHRRDAPERAREAEVWDLELCARHGLAAVPLRCEQGECLLWHHSLLHGGGPLADERLTRQSFVVHYTSRANMPTTKNSYLDPYVEPGPGEPRPAPRVYESRRHHVQRGCHGFASPLAEQFAAEVRARYSAPEAAERRFAELFGDLTKARAEIEAMRASRFWKLRDSWWSLKRALGLGG